MSYGWTGLIIRFDCKIKGWSKKTVEVAHIESFELADVIPYQRRITGKIKFSTKEEAIRARRELNAYRFESYQDELKKLGYSI